MTVYCLTLGFVPSRIWKQSVEQYYKLKSAELEVKHYFLNQHYPMREHHNTPELQAICRDYNVEWMDAGKNLGLHEGLNFMARELKIKGSDHVLGYDPDSWPVSPGFDMALYTCFQKSDVAWASLMGERSVGELKHKGGARYNISQVRVQETREAIVNSICMWNYDFIIRAGGFKEPNAFYGGIEVMLWPDLQVQKKKWVFTEDWKEEDKLHHEHDREYQIYKWKHAHEGTWRGDFESYLLSMR